MSVKRRLMALMALSVIVSFKLQADDSQDPMLRAIQGGIDLCAAVVQNLDTWEQGYCTGVIQGVHYLSTAIYDRECRPGPVEDSANVVVERLNHMLELRRIHLDPSRVVTDEGRAMMADAASVMMPPARVTFQYPVEAISFAYMRTHCR